jgi:phosphoglycolate phosphatase
VKPCLIFDLDGTLVDSLDGIAASLNRSLASHGLPGHSHANVRSFVGDGLKTLVERAAPRGSDTALIKSLITLFKKDYEQSWQQGTSAYPGIHNLLDELQKDGFLMGVLSNKTHDFTVSMTRALFPKIHFGAVLGQRDGIPHKPHPAGAFQIAAVLGAAPKYCRIIGDSTIDMETAANAEMKPIAITWGYHDRARLITTGAVDIIDHPSELPALLR